MPNDPTRIVIINGRERRRRYSAEQKLALVEETMQPGMTVSPVAHQRGVSPSLLFKWRQLMSQGGQVAVKADEDVVAASRARELEGRVRELERLLGRKTMEVELLKEALTFLMSFGHGSALNRVGGPAALPLSPCTSKACRGRCHTWCRAHA